MDPLAEMVLLGVCTENDLGVPPPIVELRARVPEISIKSSESSSLSEYPVVFEAEVSTDHDPSGSIITESTDLGVSARISLKYLEFCVKEHNKW
jgi:hypothetical protein